MGEDEIPFFQVTSLHDRFDIVTWMDFAFVQGVIKILHGNNAFRLKSNIDESMG